jgi:Zn-dependent protease
LSAGLARWTNRLCVLMQWLVACAGWLAGIGLCALALRDVGNPVLVAFMLTSLLWLAALIIHEGGHYVAARSAGMTVLSVRIGRIELAPQQHGWRVRWGQRRKLLAAGYVIAAHDPTRPLRGQSIRMIAGGPGANLLVATIAGAWASLWLPDAGAWLLLAFAVVNAAMSVANLIPSFSGLGSDGLKLLQWCDPKRELNLGLTHAKLLALIVSGVTVDQLPEDQLAVLDAQPAPMPVVALWYRLKAQQHRGEWEVAAGQQAKFEQLEQELSSELRSQLVELLICIRTELAFSRAIRDRDARHLNTDSVSEKTFWSCPTLWPRCLALRALLGGDVAEGQRLLDETLRRAAQSMDRSLAKSEAMIRSHMLAVLAGA